MIRQLIFLLVLPLLWTACARQKEVTKPTATVAEKEIKPDTTKLTKSPKPLPYRGSATRSNDILHTRIEVDFDWKTCRMNGKATITAKPHFGTVDWLYLNARGMEIKKVDLYTLSSMTEQQLAGGKMTEITREEKTYLSRAAWIYENDSIKINFSRPLSGDDKYLVEIEYTAKPNEITGKGGSAAITDDKGLYFINAAGENPYKMPQIWTQGETSANSAWFPTIDNPNEKMTQEILITVDEKYTTLSNGVLQRSFYSTPGKRTDHWKLDQAHAPYLAMMAVGEFVKITDEPYKGKEVSYYVEKEFAPVAKDLFGETPHMLAFFSEKLGVEFPWPKYAQIVVRDYVSGAMENTSATLHGDFLIYQTKRELLDGKKGTDVISHELFHQWFGDLVTCESWSNLPLNESFATYGEYLWREFRDGRDAADDHSWQSRMGYLHGAKNVDLIRFHYADQEDMFDGVSYNKGGQILHMLRKAVGDEAFFAALKLYLESNRYKAVEVHHLRLAFEEITGEDMNWFFDQWFLNKGHPKLKITLKENVSANLELTVEQQQDLANTPLYRLPLEVDLYVNGKAERRHINITEQAQTFTFVTQGPVQLLNFDAERQLLAELDYKKPVDAFVFQYQHAPLYGDRLEALRGLENNLDVPVVRSLFISAAQNDPYFQLRNFAISTLGNSEKPADPELKTVMMGIFSKDKNTITRTKALQVLNKKFAAEEDVRSLNEKALAEPSYKICAEAFTAYWPQNPEKAFVFAKQFETEGGKDILFPVAMFYASRGDDEQAAFFQHHVKALKGREQQSFCSFYAKISLRFKKHENVLRAINDIESVCKAASKREKLVTAKTLQYMLTAWEQKEKDELAKTRTDKVADPKTEAILQEISATKAAITAALERIKT